MQKTNYRRGFQRLLLVVSVFWCVGWGLTIYGTWTDRRHYNLVMWHHKGQGQAATITHLIFANSKPEYGGYYLASEDVVIAGQKYGLFFRSDDPDLKRLAAAYAKNLPPKDAEEIQSVAAFSRESDVVDDLWWALGVPAGLLVMSVLGMFLYRGFRPQSGTA